MKGKNQIIVCLVLTLLSLFILSSCGETETTQSKTVYKLSGVIDDLITLTNDSDESSETISSGIYLKTTERTTYYSLTFLKNIRNDTDELGILESQFSQDSLIVCGGKAIEYENYDDSSNFFDESKYEDAEELLPLTTVVYDIENGKSRYIDGISVEDVIVYDVDASSELVSRTTGIAPLSVHFQAENFSNGQEFNDDFHNYEYEWDFDDPNSGVWETTGKSRDTAKGPVAVHVFEYPGTYSIIMSKKDKRGTIEKKRFKVEVIDPDLFYAGENTICVSDTANNDFTGAPSGSLNITTDDLSTITHYVTEGKRLLFRRDSSWTISDLSFSNNSGPVTFGAFGSGDKPKINVNSGAFVNVTRKQNWRIMDIEIDGLNNDVIPIGGAIGMEKLLFLRLDISRCTIGISSSTYGDGNEPRVKDQVSIVDCKITDNATHCVYFPCERLALLGNEFANAGKSHVVRVPQAYKSVISNNYFSGASLDTNWGRHALKLHGPMEHLLSDMPTGSEARNRTEFTVISDNVFGQSAPYTIAIGPQNAVSDERLSNLLIERNKFISDFGEQNHTKVVTPLYIWARNITIKNNIFDGNGSLASDYMAIRIDKRGVEPDPERIRIYNNTVFKPDNSSGTYRNVVRLGEEASDIEVVNNLYCFPESSALHTGAVFSPSENFIAKNNLLVNESELVNATDTDSLDRDFSLKSGSTAIDSGYNDIFVISDFDDHSRDQNIDVGAFEF